MTRRALAHRAAAAGLALTSAVVITCTALPAAAATTPSIETSPRDVLVHWGTQVDPTQASAVAGLLAGLDRSGYVRGLAAAYGGTGRAAYAGAGVIPDASLPSGVDGSTIASTVSTAIARAELPAVTDDTNYVVMLPPGVALPTDPQTQQPACSLHEPFRPSGIPADIIVLPDYTDTASTCGRVGSDPAAAATSNLSRQFVDTVTDPMADGTSGIYATGSATELGDACASAVALGNVDGWVVQPWWSNAAGACTFGIVGVSMDRDVAAATNARQAIFMLHDTESSGGQAPFSCSVDGAAVSCGTANPLAATGLAAGTHSAIVSVDGVGSTSSSWLVDLSAPVARLRRPTASITLARHLTVAYAGTDTGGAGVAAYDVRLRVAAWNAGFGRWRQPRTWQGTARTAVSTRVKPGRTYCFSVRAQDAAGNIQPSWSAPRCTAVPLDDRALALTRGWERVASPAAFGGSLVRGSAPGARLRLVGAHVDRVALVVRTCPACGRIAVYRGGRLVRTVNTHSATLHNRVVRLSPRFALRTTTVSLQVVGSAPVYLDAVAVQTV